MISDINHDIDIRYFLTSHAHLKFDQLCKDGDFACIPVCSFWERKVVSRVQLGTCYLPIRHKVKRLCPETVHIPFMGLSEILQESVQKDLDALCQSSDIADSELEDVSFLHLSDRKFSTVGLLQQSFYSLIERKDELGEDASWLEAQSDIEYLDGRELTISE